MRMLRTIAVLTLLLSGFGGVAQAQDVPPSVSISGHVFVDADSNGLYDPTIVPGDAPLAGHVTLTGPDGSPVTDVNGLLIGTAQAGVPNLMTGAGSGETSVPGRFEFLDLPVLAAGEAYTVSIETPAGRAFTLVTPSDGVLTTSTLDTAGASDDTLDFIFARTGPWTQVRLGPVQDFPLSADQIETSLITPGVPTDMAFTAYSVGTEAVVDVDMWFSIDPDDGTEIICDPPATPEEPSASEQVLVEFAGPFEPGTSITCRFTVRALSPGERAGFSVVFQSSGASTGTLAPGGAMPSWSLIATVPEATTSTTSPSTVAAPDPAVGLAVTGFRSTVFGWAAALITAGVLLSFTAKRRSERA